ncbi:unnamed protein product [Ophioblennius macclurei]
MSATPLAVGVFLCGASVAFCRRSEELQSNISTFSRFENETVGEDPSFVHLRTRLPSYLQPIRPYALGATDDHEAPEPRLHRPSRLRRLLGSSFDPFWMSVDEPPEAFGGRRPLLPHHEGNATELRDAAETLRRELEEQAAALDLHLLPLDAAVAVRRWLADAASCDLHQQWVDLGAAFWPRWLRRTDCDGRSCSFPRGMACVRARTALIHILAWNCVEVRGQGDRSGKVGGERSDLGAEAETSWKCLWRKVSHPVVTACRCACE